VEVEIKAAQSSVRKRRSGGDDDDNDDDDVDLSFAEATRRVQDEVGDLIFDVIMLACVCERDFGGCKGRFSSGFTLAGAAANASAKVKRRCPYSFGPRARLGPCPDRATEEAAWADVKALEKASRAPGGDPMPPAPPTRSSAWDRCFERGGFFDGAVLPVAVAAAFATGCVFGARSWR
jgi:NTP pyrophosphatase (non-canonical NTP hydrolase)